MSVSLYSVSHELKLKCGKQTSSKVASLNDMRGHASFLLQSHFRFPPYHTSSILSAVQSFFLKVMANLFEEPWLVSA